MIYTVTVNPAIDYIVKTEGFEKGKINKYKDGKYFAGGKGVNVSLMLSELEEENTAVVVVAGFSGEEIVRILDEKNCNPSPVRLNSGHSRINYKIRDFAGELESSETDFNGAGPEITDEVIDKVIDRLKGITKNDTLVLAGNVQRKDTYKRILDSVKDSGAQIIVDAVGDVLKSTLSYHPFMIKPNLEELGDFFGIEIKAIEEAETYGRKLIELGAENVIVSLGEKGAMLISQDRDVIVREAVCDTVVSTVGAGDSLIAGFIHGYKESGDLEQALKYAVAAGCATTFSHGIAKRNKFDEVLIKCDK